MSDKSSCSVDEDVYRRLWRARRFIDACYDRPLDLECISSEACFSRYHFIRLFKQAFHRTPHQYLVEKRIERAKELLASSRLSVTDVCFEVGFQSLGSFSTLFQKRTGSSPLIYRNLLSACEKASKTCSPWVPFCFEMMYGARQSQPGQT